MSEFFKCCKTKTNSNLICVTCKNIFHPSCMKRSRGYRVVDQNLIWCSAECECSSGDEESDAIKALQITIRDLRRDLQIKDAHIERIKRNSTAFENDATEIEAKLLSENEAYKLKMNELKQELKEKKKVLDSVISVNAVNSETQRLLKLNTVQTQTTVITRTCETQTGDKYSLRSSQTQTKTVISHDKEIQVSLTTSNVVNSETKTELNAARTQIGFLTKTYETQTNNSESSFQSSQAQTNTVMSQSRGEQTSLINVNVVNSETQKELSSEPTQTAFLTKTYETHTNDNEIALQSPQTQTNATTFHNTGMQTSLINVNAASTQTKITWCLSSETQRRVKERQINKNKAPHFSFVNDASQNCFDSVVKRRKPQLLLIGNKTELRGLPMLFKRKSLSKFDINGQYSERPLMMEEIVKINAKLSLEFTKDDHVVLFTGSHNAIKGKLPSEQFLKNLIDHYKNTNLLIVGSSYVTNRKILNMFLYKINIMIKTFLHNNACGDVKFIPMKPSLNAYKSNVSLVDYICRDFLIVGDKIRGPTQEQVLLRACLSFEERLANLLGRPNKVDDWFPKITSFPREYPLPTEAVRRMNLSVDLTEEDIENKMLFAILQNDSDPKDFLMPSEVIEVT